MMDNDSKNKLNDVLSTVEIESAEFQWFDTNSTLGVTAQEISTIDLSSGSMADTITITGINDISGAYLTSNVSGNNWANGHGFSFASGSSFNADTTEYGKTTIKTAKSTIDIDELADMMETLKKRLLIIAPNFEKHEKYPMLKEMYDEYKAMEALLSGPDSNE
jgi:hypothetical protein